MRKPSRRLWRLRRDRRAKHSWGYVDNYPGLLQRQEILGVGPAVAGLFLFWRRLFKVLVHPVGPAFVDVHLADGVAGGMAGYGIGEKLYFDAVVL